MSLVSRFRGATTHLADGVHHSVRRARLEGDRRVLQRRHRAALEALGARTHELVTAGALDGELLRPELSDVDSRVMEIDALSRELDAHKDA